MKVGTSDVSRVFVGNTFAKRIYVGQDKAYDIYNDPVEQVFLNRASRLSPSQVVLSPQYGHAEIDKIKGNSIVWNQLVNTIETQTINDATFTQNADGSITVNGTATAVAALMLVGSGIIKNSHKYLLCGGQSDDSWTTRRLFVIKDGAGKEMANPYVFFTTDATGTYQIALRVNNGVTVNNVVYKPQLFDLTSIFGAGNEPATVDEFNALYPLPYYPYNTGEVKNNTCARLEKVMWNQLVQSRTQSSTSNQVTCTPNGDGSFSLSGTATGECWFLVTPSNISVVAGHRYFLRGCPAGGSNTTYSLFESSGRLTQEFGSGSIKDVTTSSDEISIRIVIRNGFNTTGLKFWPQLFDLTLMFGAGNEPTLEKCEQIFTEDYYPYDAGTEKEITIERGGIENTGFNQWDEEWELGGYNVNTGAPTNVTDKIRSKKDNPISVFPSTNYYFKTPSEKTGIVFFYDGNLNYISRTYSIANTVFTTPSNTRYVKFYMNEPYGTTYNNDICINISDTSKNGTYEPSWKSYKELPITTKTGKLNGQGSSVVIFPEGAKSVGETHDEITSTTAIKRIGKRAYQSGDESDTSVLTDGTNTLYVLATQEEYTLDTPLSTELQFDYTGTQKITQSDNIQAPFIADMKLPK